MQTIYKTVILAALLASASSQAEEDSQRKRPPAAAIEACAASVEGDPCGFEGRRGNDVQGTCASKADRPLACRPERKSRRGLVDEEMEAEES